MIVITEVPDPVPRAVFSKEAVLKYFLRVVSISSVGLQFGLFLTVGAEEWPGALLNQGK